MSKCGKYKRTDEIKKKNSISNMGHITTDESNRKRSETMNKYWNDHPETKELISIQSKIRWDDEHKSKQSEIITAYWQDSDYIEKQRISRSTPEYKKLVSDIHKNAFKDQDYYLYWLSSRPRGSNAPNWKGGISYEPYCPKFNDDLKERVRSYFNYECVLCGKPQSENLTKNGRLYKLNVHHVEYNKSACCDNKIVNFAALCNRCHGKTGSERDNYENMIHIIIYELYNDRSYYTKEEYKKLKMSLRKV